MNVLAIIGYIICCSLLVGGLVLMYCAAEKWFDDEPQARVTLKKAFQPVVSADAVTDIPYTISVSVPVLGAICLAVGGLGYTLLALHLR